MRFLAKISSGRRGVHAALTGLGFLLVAAGALALFDEARRPEDAARLQARARDVLAECQSTVRPLATLDLRAYVAADVLIDESARLPQFHRFARDDLRALRAWEAGCEPPTRSIDDPRLAKAVTWARARCGAPLPHGYFGSPPYMHPSGRSYVALAVEHGIDASSDPAWRTDHARFAHILEWDRLLDASSLDLPHAAAVDLDARAVEQMSLPRALVLTPRFLLSPASSSGLFPERRYEVRAREEWQTCFEAAGLIPTNEPARCATRTQGLCVTVRAPRARGLGAGLLACGALMLLIVTGRLVWLVRRERERVVEGRVLALRTLSHEMRTPVTSLTLALERVRPAFDDLSEEGQATFLDMCESVERMRATIDLAAEYVSAEGAGQDAHALSTMTLSEIIEDVVDGVDADVEVQVQDDAPFVGDRRWIVVCLRNLLENAVVHGAPPFGIEARNGGRVVTLIVCDGGDLRGQKLADLVAPHRSSRQSLGLGLAIVDRAARALGGELRVESAPTRFILSLAVPVRPDASRPADRR